MKNNNNEIIKLLAYKSYKYNKIRNYVLIGAISFTVMTILSIFSLSKGKIEANRLLYMRNAGTSAYTTLERANEIQYNEIKQLAYIKQIGKYIKIGNNENFPCVVLDDAAWEDFQKPAYTDIHGVYPNRNDEIMLSVRSLEALGITNPEIGMKIDLEIKTLDDCVVKRDFFLSGYYTEYVDDMIALPNGYFSWNILNDFKINQTTLLIKQKESVSRENIEKMLYDDIEMIDDTQQFVGGNSITKEQIYKLVGGYDIAIILVILILAVAFLLIYNILRISSNKDIRQYGLLRILGTTPKQLKKILVRQATKITVIGCCMGVFLGSIISVLIISDIVSDMYLSGYGGMDDCRVLSPSIVFFSVVFCAIIVYLGTINVVKKIAKQDPIKTVNAFEENKQYRYKNHRNSSENNVYSINLTNMAWRNIMKRKTQFFIIVISVSLGLIVALSSQVILKGTDIINEIKHENHDFSIMTNMTANMVGEYKEGDIFWDYELENKIRGLPNLKYLNVTSGGYGLITEENKALEFYSENRGSDNFVVQILNEQNEKDIVQFIRDNDLDVDINSLKEGNGIILLHYHALSKIQEDKAIQSIGKTITINDMNGNPTTQMLFSGVIDFTLPDFPDIETTWNSNNIMYFLVSEEGFDKMNLTRQIFRVDMDVNPKEEPVIRQNLENLISQYNKKYARETKSNIGVGINDLRTLSITSKSDILAGKMNSIKSNTMLMSSFCFIIILMGMVNYINSTITGLTIRKKEFAVMESIGLTKKQLRKILIMEGCFYSLSISSITICFGSIIWYALDYIMKSRVKYFKFSYPLIPMIVGIIMLFMICIAIPVIIEKKGNKESLTDKLKLYTD